MNRSTPGLPVHHQLQELTELTFIESVMPSSHLILCRSLLLLPPIPPRIRVLSNESTLRMRWSKYWSFNFSISPSKEHPGLISFRVDWLDLLAVQGILKSLLQHHSSKASIVPRSAFFIVQLSHPYMTTGKTIALTRRTFVGKVMSLLFNMLSMFISVQFSRSVVSNSLRPLGNLNKLSRLVVILLYGTWLTHRLRLLWMACLHELQHSIFQIFLCKFKDEFQGGKHISCWCLVESNTVLWSNYASIKNKF